MAAPLQLFLHTGSPLLQLPQRHVDIRARCRQSLQPRQQRQVPSHSLSMNPVQLTADFRKVVEAFRDPVEVFMQPGRRPVRQLQRFSDLLNLQYKLLPGAPQLLTDDLNPLRQPLPPLQRRVYHAMQTGSSRQPDPPHMLKSPLQPGCPFGKRSTITRFVTAGDCNHDGHPAPES